MTGFVLFAHGSRVETANQAVRDVASQLSAEARHPVEAGFLELGEPPLAGAIHRLVELGISRIVVIPYFLTLGTHMQRDLPKLARDSMKAHPQVEIEVAPPLDGHPALVKILLDRTKEALARNPGPV